MKKDTKRDSEITRQLLLDSVEAVLSEKGYRHLTAQEVATEAGVGSYLITHYFRSFNKLLKTYIHENDFWLQEGHLLHADPQKPQEYLAAVFKQQFHHILENKEMQKIIHWELSDYHPVISKMARKRENEGLKLLQKFKGHFVGADVDLEGIGAIVLPGLNALVLQGRAGNSTVFGIDVNSERGQERICRTVDLIFKVLWEAAEKDQIDNI